MTGARIYGRNIGNGSHARVTAGFRSAFEAAGVLEGFVSLDEDAIDGPVPPGAFAPWAIHTGPLGLVGQMLRNARHEHRAAMVAPNSDRIPQALAAALHAHCTELLAPSDWAADVLASEFERYEHPMRITAVPHGVDPAFCLDRESRDGARQRFRDGAFDVLHFSTSDRQRKGTLELVAGWRFAQAELGPRASLWLVLDPAAAMSLQAAILDREPDGAPGLPESVHVIPRADASTADMCRMLSSVHLVCQPSRGEAFGLVPLEALASGVPVAATTCTGHGEYLGASTPGLVPIGTSGYADIDDAEGARAPVVDPFSVAASLVRGRGNWMALADAAEGNAEALRAAWLWEKTLGPLIDHIRGQEGATDGR